MKVKHKNPILVHLFLQTQVFPDTRSDDELQFNVGEHVVSFIIEHCCIIMSMRFGNQVLPSKGNISVLELDITEDTNQ